MATPPATLHELPADRFRALLPELIDIYVAAMGYPPGTAGARTPLWHDHARRDGFRAIVAVGPDDAPLGLAYGYTGRPGQWWHDEVARGLRVAGLTDAHGRAPILTDYFELTELHVRPGHQGSGTGEALLRALVAPVTSRTVLLSTPEGDSRAWHLYRRLGFADLLRNFLFTGDGRPFAVLARALPLPPPVPPASDRRAAPPATSR